ncbi:MAG TPA: lmo0937 family membrane protein [Kofleriaceae bacterium]
MAANLQFLWSGGKLMLLALAVILAIAWLLGFSVFHVASAAIHILVVLAVVALIVHFVQGRSARTL